MATQSSSFISSSPLLLVDSHSLPISCFSSSISRFLTLRITTSLRSSSRFPAIDFRSSSRRLNSSSVAVMLSGNSVLSDVYATGISSIVAFSCLGFWGEIGKRGIFDQKLIRKFVHINIGLVFMLCWPLFSSGNQGALLASLVPGLNIIRMLLLGFGVYQDEGTIKSMSRHGDRRELLKGPLYYALSITLACIFYWKSSPIAIAVICNLCAGDGMADIVGRRLGKEKLPYNKNKSFAGSIGMATAGFLASVGYMYYFASFGYMEASGGMILRFFIISIASALVESLPISTDIDDNLTISLTSTLVGTLLF
ncbi:Farnesol kinase [Cardamine amara subsp. amara]|uniref:Farnesol kinase n=1 Tax=Cardamine amara subsp. amara TaxID=228776 RepID=A0ABD1BKA2_CARAN